MSTRVTSKGQVTIPKEMRERFGVEPGTEVDFVATSAGLTLQKATVKGGFHEVIGLLEEELKGRSVEQLLEELRGPVDVPHAQ